MYSKPQCIKIATISEFERISLLSNYTTKVAFIWTSVNYLTQKIHQKYCSCRVNIKNFCVSHTETTTNERFASYYKFKIVLPDLIISKYLCTGSKSNMRQTCNVINYYVLSIALQVTILFMLTLILNTVWRSTSL